MKRSILLTLIPAMMVLCSCSSVKLERNKNTLNEDALAHEEVFGNGQEVEYLTLENRFNAPTPASLVQPLVGVQYIKSDDNDDALTTISIRYVAAIGDNLNVTAKWVRGLAFQNDTESPKKKYDSVNGVYNYQESNVAYTELTNNGNVAKAVDLGGDYHYFVVYTLLNIPYNTYKYCYLGAYLELKDNSSAEVKKSDVVAIEVGQNHHTFSFSNSINGYFIEGKVNGLTNQVKVLDDDLTGTNLAQETMDLQALDNFGVFKWTPTDFRFYGHTDWAYDNTNMYQETSLSSNYSEVGGNANYTLFVNASNKFGLSPAATPTVSTTFSVDMSGCTFETVAINGNFTGGWNAVPMVEGANDIWSVTISDLEYNHSYSYKFVSTIGNTDTWESGADRSITATQTSLPSAFFNKYSFTFRVNMGELPVQSNVYVAGNFTSWESGKIEMMREGESSTYSVTCLIDKGYSLEYKYMNGSTWETRGNRNYNNLECNFITDEYWNS